MKTSKEISYLNFGLFVLLSFLILFEKNLALTPFPQILGRMHPVLLHLPIGISFFLLIVHWYSADKKLLNFGLNVLTMFSLLSAIFGLFLAQEGGYDQNVLSWHKWMAFGFCLSCFLASSFLERPSTNLSIYTIVLITINAFVIITGHLGGNITHGEHFLWEPIQKPAVVDNTVFAQKIQPILKEKCISCHNDRKQKGDLSMVAVDKMLSGGKDGPLWVAGDSVNSLLLLRIGLPLDNKKHMPPKDKNQLSVDEIQTLKDWIISGADVNAPTAGNKQKNEVSQYTFQHADSKVIESLSSPYLSIAPIADGSPALDVAFFIKSKFEMKALKNLEKIKSQIISINLAGMPVGDEVFRILAGFDHLENLNLNGTNINGENIEELMRCKVLREVSLSNTSVSEVNAKKLAKHPHLKKLFLWNTKASDTSEERFSKINPKLLVEYGYQADSTEFLKLNSPKIHNKTRIISGKEDIVCSHVLPGTEIRYTLDGTIPDSLNSPIYTQPIEINQFTNFKAIAIKKGWLASNVLTRPFFYSSLKAEKVDLENEPNKDYSGQGASGLNDLVQGDENDFKEKNWMAFREQPFIATFHFKDKVPKGLSVSYLLNSNSFIVHPESVEVWGKNEDSAWKKLNQLSPDVIKREEQSIQVVGINIPFNGTWKYIKVVVNPLSKLPVWHRGKGEKGWFLLMKFTFIKMIKIKNGRNHSTPRLYL